MDWGEFFEETRKAAGIASIAKLALKLGVTDGAIHHYKVGRTVPPVWVVADCLAMQGHDEPEKKAVEIMRREARTAPERGFYKRLLSATAAIALCAIPLASFPAKAGTYAAEVASVHIMLIRKWLASLISPRNTVWNRPGATATLRA